MVRKLSIRPRWPARLQLNDPSPAHFKGDEDVPGLTLHSALWSDDIKLDDKQSVIGTGRDRHATGAVDRRPRRVGHRLPAHRAMGPPAGGPFRPITEGRAVAARASAVLRAVVSLQHVLALRRWPTDVPAQGSDGRTSNGPSTKAMTGIARS